MAEIRNPRLLCAKAALFVLLGLSAATLILIDSPNLRTASLLGVTVWAFARAYYFAFYVLQRYVDPTYRFAGLLSLAAYVLRRRRGG